MNTAFWVEPALRLFVLAVFSLLPVFGAVYAGEPPGINSVTQGMSRADVVGVMGRPAGAMRMGGKDILVFKDGEVELAGDRVVAVKHYAAKAPQPASGQTPVPSNPAATNAAGASGRAARAGAQPPAQATMAHEILKLEARFGANQRDEGVLNALLAKAKKTLPAARANPDGQEAKKCLEAVQAFLRQEGFEYRETEFLFQALRTRKSDCDTSVLIYCAIGEVMDYPLGAVVLPRHAFVRWTLPHGNVVNWETTETNRNASFSDGSYYEWLMKGMTGEGCNLKTLKREQLPAIHHYMAGLALADANRRQDALKEHDEALKLDPAWYLSRLEKSEVLLSTRSYAAGANESLKAMEYLPVDELGQLSATALALALFAKQEDDIDRKQLGRIVNGFMRHDSDSAGYVLLSAMDAFLGDRASSGGVEIDNACAKWPANFVPFLCRGVLRMRGGSAESARSDFAMAMKLMEDRGIKRAPQALDPYRKKE